MFDSPQYRTIVLKSQARLDKRLPRRYSARMNSELLLDARAGLGECPVWEARTQTLYWLDILGQRVHMYRDGTDRFIQLDELPGCLAPRKNGKLLLALGNAGRLRFADLDPDSAKLHPVFSLEDEPPTNRFNDGKCDPAGRFLAGTMDHSEKESSGSLYSFDGKKNMRLFTGTRISNGLAWSPDYKTFYYIDTPTRLVQAFDYDLKKGELANPRLAIQIPESLGWPDGMTSDMDGNLWIAMWGGAQVTKWNPNNGKWLDQVSIPAPHTSSCVFGGADMNELLITSARKDLSAGELTKYPHSGGVFRVETNVIGMPSFEFGI